MWSAKRGMRPNGVRSLSSYQHPGLLRPPADTGKVERTPPLLGSSSLITMKAKDLRREWIAQMVWFTKLNNEILESYGADGRWWPAEMFSMLVIVDVLDRMARMTALISRTPFLQIPSGTGEFREFRRSSLAVVLRLKSALRDEYELVEDMERWERRFFLLMRVRFPALQLFAWIECRRHYLLPRIRSVFLYLNRTFNGGGSALRPVRVMEIDEDVLARIANRVNGKGLSRRERCASSFAGQPAFRGIEIPASFPQRYVVKGRTSVITARKAIEIVDKLLAKYFDVSDAYIDLPENWQSNFRRGDAHAFLKNYIQCERINNRYTGRARLVIP